MFERRSAGGFAACKPPQTSFPAAMERPPREYPEADETAKAAALTGPGMIVCRRGPQGEMKLSERQCLVNQERARLEGFPSFCLGCPEGREIQKRHPEGVGKKARKYSWGYGAGPPRLAEPPPPQPPAPPAAKPMEKISPPADRSINRSIDRPIDAWIEAAAALPVCEAHGLEVRRDKLGRRFCPRCRRERLLKAQTPRCGEHGCKKTQDKLGRWRCERCMSIQNRRNRAGGRQKEAEVKKMETGMCPNHPEVPQKKDHRGDPLGVCETCLKNARPGTPGAHLPPVSLNCNTGREAAPRCPKHPEAEQKRGKDGRFLGQCVECLRENARNCAAKRVANNAARQAKKAGDPPPPFCPSPQNGSAPAQGPEREIAQFRALDGPALLAKLPDFDPAWPDEVKLKWLEAFGKLVARSDGLESPPPPGRQAGRQAGRGSQVDGPEAAVPEAEILLTEKPRNENKERGIIARDNKARRPLPAHLRGASAAVKRAYEEG